MKFLQKLGRVTFYENYNPNRDYLELIWIYVFKWLGYKGYSNQYVTVHVALSWRFHISSVGYHISDPKFETPYKAFINCFN